MGSNDHFNFEKLIEAAQKELTRTAAEVQKFVEEKKPVEAAQRELTKAFSEVQKFVDANLLHPPTTVFVGRKSVCMADDCNHPNMFTVELTENPDDFVDALFGHGLPCYLSWKGYPGRRGHSAGDFGGCAVCDKASDEVLFTIDVDNRLHKFTYEFAEDWHRKIKRHPYIYCE